MLRIAILGVGWAGTRHVEAIRVLARDRRSGSYIGEVEAITYPNIVTKFRMVCPNN